MTDGKHCPVCGIDIGIWPIFSAGLPNLIRCPKCRARLAYQDTALVFLILLPILGAVVAAAYYIGASFEGNHRLIAYVVVLFGAWVPVELGVAKYLRENKPLERRGGGVPPPEERSA